MLTLLYSRKAIFGESVPAWLFMVINLVLSCVVPAGIILSLLPLSFVIRFITYHKIDLRRVIPVLLPGVTIKAQSGKSYWCIADRFYFFMDIKSQYYHKTELIEMDDISKQPAELASIHKNVAIDIHESNVDNHESSSIKEDAESDIELKNLNTSSTDNNEISSDSPDRKSKPKLIPRLSLERASTMKHAYQERESLATWLIYGMLIIIFMISFTYFVYQTMIYEQSINSCSKLSNKERHLSYCYSDLRRSRANIVNCNSNDTTNYTVLYCFIVLEIVEHDPINKLISTIIFFYITGVATSVIFHIVKFLLNFYLTKLWGILVIVMGTVLFVLFLTVSLAIFLTDAQSNILFLFEAFSLSADFILVGALLVIGTPMEEVKDYDFFNEEEIENPLKRMI